MKTRAGRPLVGTGDVVVALAVMGMLAMLLLPMPTWVVDLGVAANLATAVVLLASALYVRDPLAFSSFPTLLLLSTLGRLALNVTSTRLILLSADAGRVIDAFGHAVVRGDYAVGALVFAMLTAVQFVVVARGAERIAEVSARFSLDALPGKQLAIEAELRAGQIGASEGRRAREALSRESELLGALDGAMKFVKGDAIAGLIIAAINAFGGVGIGTLKRGLSLSDSAQRYGLLAIGDALASQLPSLLSAAAAGLLVTRMASRSGDASVAEIIARELLGDARVLAVGAVVLALLASAPGLPALPFAAMSLGLLALTLRAYRNTAARQPAEHAIELRVHSDVSADVRAALAAEHARLAQRLGLPLPALQVREHADTPKNCAIWHWRGVRVNEVVSGTDSAALVPSLASLVRDRAQTLVTLDVVGDALDTLARTEPRLVREAVPARVSAVELQQLLIALVDEDLGLSHLPRVLDALTRALPKPAHHAARVAVCRRALSEVLATSLAPSGEVTLLRLSPEVEETIADALRGDTDARYLALSASLSADIRAAVRTAAALAPTPKALLTSAEIRAHVRVLIRTSLPDLPVICADELHPQLRVLAGPLISP